MTGVSTLAQAIRQIENIKTQQLNFSDLSTQLATGKKTQSYSGLDVDALTSVRSRTNLSSLEIFSGNIKRADVTINLMLASVGEFQAQTEEFSNSLINFIQEGNHQRGEDVFFDDPLTTENDAIVVGNTSREVDTALQAVIDHANSLFGFLGDLMNAKEGDRYLLAGADSAQRPYTDNGTLDASISTLLTQWKSGAITTDDLLADLFDGTALNGNPDAITDTTVGFSSSLSNNNAGKVFIRASEGSEFEYTTLANEEALRNIMVVMSVIRNENFSPIVDVYENGVFPGVPDVEGAPGTTAREQQENFYALYNGMTTRVQNSIDEIDTIRFRLETVRAQANETSKSQDDQRQLLLNTIGDIEDIDSSEVAVRLTTLQTQLEASFSVTAITQRLSLINFL